MGSSLYEQYRRYIGVLWDHLGRHIGIRSVLGLRQMVLGFQRSGAS